MIENQTKIRVMDDTLASQVAAGEVVESPASIVKELIENSIDAGAESIDIIIERGGKALVKVIDDGVGMNKPDAVLSIERHATSKLLNKNDLNNISTYGFRGEALPSIASVSDFKLTTTFRGNDIGTEITIKGGKLIAVNECGSKSGSQVEIRSLFYNVPARKKFLKSDSVEFSRIEKVVLTSAISTPNIAYTLYHGKRLAIKVAKSDNLKNRIHDIFGSELSDELLKLEQSEDKDISVSGFVTKPGCNFNKRKLQYIFVNGRAVKSTAINIAVNDAYSGLIDKGHHPALFLFIEANPNEIDVNIHPTKQEIKFNHIIRVQKLITNSIIECIKKDLDGGGNIDVSIPCSRVLNDQDSVDSENNQIEDIYDESLELLEVSTELFPSKNEIKESNSPKYKIHGLLKDRFVLIETEEGLMIMSKRSAHERVLYESALNEFKAEKLMPIQKLLVPISLDLESDEFEFIFSYEDKLKNLGFIFEKFGGNTIKLDGVPAFFKTKSIEVCFRSIVSRMLDGGFKSARDLSMEELISGVAVMTSQYFDSKSLIELQNLLENLLNCEMPYVDTRGRPTLYQISYKEIERKLGVK